MADAALTIPAVAERLSVSTKTVRRRIHAGELRAKDLGVPGRTKLRVLESQLAAYLKTREV